MRAVWSAIAVASTLGLSALAAGSANASTTMYDFQGACRDCASYGEGTLTLSNPVNGALTKADFVSFIYKSNLVSFKLDSDAIVAVMGSIDPTNLGASYIDILQLGGTGWEFDLNPDGSWSVSSNLTQGAEKPNTSGGGGSGSGAAVAAPASRSRTSARPAARPARASSRSTTRRARSTTSAATASSPSRCPKPRPGP